MIKIQESGIEAFRRVSKTFKRWKEEILNSFTYPFSNGYIEGVNNTIKVLKLKELYKKLLKRDGGMNFSTTTFDKEPDFLSKRIISCAE